VEFDGGDLKKSMARGILLHTVDEIVSLRHVPPNYAFERPVKRRTSARVRPVHCLPPSARLKRLRPAAQRER
jgi:hypothetical protein